MYSMEGPAALQVPEPCCEPEICSPDRPARLAVGGSADEVDVVIRAANSAADGRMVSCDTCGTRFVAAGPTAYSSDRPPGNPLCDACVFDHDVQLAMVLAAVSVLRAFGSAEPSEADAQAALDLLSFARIYEAFAEKHGPRREPSLPAS